MTKAERSALLRQRFQAIKSPFAGHPIVLKHSRDVHERRRGWKFKGKSEHWKLEAGNALLAHSPQWAVEPIPKDRHELGARRQAFESPYVAIARQLLPARLTILD